MSIQLNHTIVWCKDQVKSANFLAEMLGRPKPSKFAHFDVVDMDNGISLDYAENGGHFSVQHYAFLVSEAEFDTIFGLHFDDVGAEAEIPIQIPFDLDTPDPLLGDNGWVCGFFIPISH